MNRTKLFSTLPAVLLLLTACGGGGSSSGSGVIPDPTFDQGILGFVNTVVDAPNLAVILASTSSGGSGVTVNFGQRALQGRTVAGFNVEIGYPDSDGTNVLLFSRVGDNNIKLFRDDETIVWLHGTIADPTAIVVENQEYKYGVAAGVVTAPQIQLYHGATSVGALDIYLTSSAADLAGSTPVASLSEGEHTALIDRTASADQRYRVTPAGDASTVLYDSGTFEIVDDTRTHVFITDYFGPGTNTITMRPVTNTNPFAFAEEATSTEVHLTNVVADVNTLELHDGAPAGAPIVSGVTYGATGIASGLTVGDGRTLTVTADGDDATEIFESSTNVLPGTFTFVFAGGLLTDGAQSEAINTGGTLVNTELRPIGTGVQVQVFNGSVDAGNRDVYLLATGETTTDEVADFTIGTGGYASSVLAVGDYELVVTAVGDNTAVLGPQVHTLTAGNYYTITLEDTPGGGGPFTARVVESAIP